MRVWVLNDMFLTLLFATSVGNGFLALWHSAESRRWEQRIGLAQMSYAEHLMLQSSIYQLFKQHADALLLGDLDGGKRETEIRAAIAGNLDRIRDTIAREIDLVGASEVAEPGHLARIEDNVNAITRAISSLTEDGTLIDPASRRAELVNLLDRDIDARLALRIEEAMDSERAEFLSTMAEAAAFRQSLRRIVGAVIFLTVGLTLLAAHAYRRSVAVPLQDLMSGVRAYEDGRYDHPVAPRGGLKFRQLGQVLSKMADGLRRRALTQAEQMQALEEAVRARTGELARVLSQIELSEANRRRMMADVSHELRTPLVIIQGEADVALRSGPHTAAVYRETLIRIRDSARHTNMIVDDLVVIARQEAGTLRLDLREIDLCQLARDSVALLQETVTLDLAVTRAVVRADPVGIRQCLVAILLNAIRHGGAQIVVRVALAPGGFAVTVADNGPGMTEAEREAAFDPFVRSRHTGPPEDEGTGLSLPVVRSIAAAHGGSVTLADRPGGGLLVSLLLLADRPIGLVWDNGAKDDEG